MTGLFMLTFPSWHAIAAILLTITTFWLFAKGRFRIELICLVLIAVLAVGFYFFPLQQDGKYTDLEIAFGGFGHEALVAICCLMILGRGLVVTGALEPAVRILTRVWRFNAALGMIVMLLACGGLSMFVNDTPVLVLAMPILLTLASRGAVMASQTLMPVNSAILIGGMATTIGTSTNLLVVSIAQDLGLPRFGVFQFTEIALTAALIAFPYLWLVMPRLLPRTTTAAVEARRLYDASLHVGTQSSLLGVTLADLDGRIGHDLRITGVLRDKVPLAMTGADLLRAGDVVLVSGSMIQLRDASDGLKTPLVDPGVLRSARSSAQASGDEEIIAELAVGSQSTLIGQSVKMAQIADRYGVVVIGTYRPDQSSDAAATHPIVGRLAAGDVLLVKGTPDAVRDMELGEGALLLEGVMDVPRTAKAGWALAIMASVIGLAAFHFVPVAIAALAGTIAMLVTGCIRFDRIGRALSAEVIVLIAASIALGRTLVETGAAEWLGTLFAFALGAFPPAVALAAIMAFTAVLTNFISNAAAAAVGTPIAVSLAAQLGIAAEPLVAAVLFGANLCFVTPMAYQTNLMIMAPGGYQFRDYVRAGLPLTILLIVSLAVLLVLRYKL